MHLFLLGPNVAYDAEICDLGVLGDFVPVDEKQVLVPCMSPSHCTFPCSILFLWGPWLRAGIIEPFPFQVR